jgi:hypothetical protein
MDVRLMAGEVEIVLMTPHRTDHEGKPRTWVRLSWANAWIIGKVGKADLTMNGCLYDFNFTLEGITFLV